MQCSINVGWLAGTQWWISQKQAAIETWKLADWTLCTAADVCCEPEASTNLYLNPTQITLSVTVIRRFFSPSQKGRAALYGA